MIHEEKNLFDKKRFYKAKDKLSMEIYKNIKYDENKHNLILVITPEMVKINFTIKNKEFIDNYGYQLYLDREYGKKLYELDMNMVISRIHRVIAKLNMLNDTAILDVIE